MAIALDVARKLDNMDFSGDSTVFVHLDKEMYNGDGDYAALEVLGDCVVLMADAGIENVVIKSNSFRQPCIGQSTHDNMSGGRWEINSSQPKKIVIDGIHIKCEPKNSNFSIGSYGFKEPPIIECINGGSIDCPETRGKRVMLEMYTVPQASTKICNDPEYAIIPEGVDLSTVRSDTWKAVIRDWNEKGVDTSDMEQLPLNGKQVNALCSLRYKGYDIKPELYLDVYFGNISDVAGIYAVGLEPSEDIMSLAKEESPFVPFEYKTDAFKRDHIADVLPDLDLHALASLDSNEQVNALISQMKSIFKGKYQSLEDVLNTDKKDLIFWYELIPIWFNFEGDTENNIVKYYFGADRCVEYTNIKIKKSLKKWFDTKYDSGSTPVVVVSLLHSWRLEDIPGTTNKCLVNLKDIEHPAIAKVIDSDVLKYHGEILENYGSIVNLQIDSDIAGFTVNQENDYTVLNIAERRNPFIKNKHIYAVGGSRLQYLDVARRVYKMPERVVVVTDVKPHKIYYADNVLGVFTREEYNAVKDYYNSEYHEFPVAPRYSFLFKNEEGEECVVSGKLCKSLMAAKLFKHKEEMKSRFDIMHVIDADGRSVSCTSLNMLCLDYSNVHLVVKRAVKELTESDNNETDFEL